MSTLAPPPLAGLTIADLSARFGPMPLRRICFDPFPGTATEQDALAYRIQQGRLFELIDGVLVEKVVGFAEALLSATLVRLLGNWVGPRDLGAVLGEGGMIRLMPGMVRVPDAAFFTWDRFPNRQVQVGTPVPALVPDLAVEVLSPSNTDEEMEQKLRDYFQSGVRLVWYIDPRNRIVTVYTAVDQAVEL